MKGSLVTWLDSQSRTRTGLDHVIVDAPAQLFT